jgi:hypothetical protein
MSLDIISKNSSNNVFTPTPMKKGMMVALHCL